MPPETNHGELTDMRRRTVLTELGHAGVVAIFRTPSPDGVLDACRALCRSGVRAVEITLTIPDALPLLASIADELDGEVVVGAGTVMDAATCRRAIDAGASFIVSPVADGSVIDVCAANDVVAVPGALTPTEVLSARSLGADVVKLFPARVATPAYLADLLGPIPGARMMPTGGIDITGVREYLAAGAFTVGVGSALVSPLRVQHRDDAAITEAARAFARAVAQART